jgi:hypothetical protein
MQVSWLNRTLIASQFLALCVTEKEYHAILNDFGIDKNNRRMWVSDGANATTHFFDANGSTDAACIVCIKNYENATPIEICGMLIHEAVHVWQDYCRRIGEDCPSSEFEAYSIQMISQRLIESFKKKVCKP